MIFSGIEMLFFTLGVISTLSLIAMVKWNKIYKFDWKAWSLLGLGLFLMIFCMAWSVSSVLEGEPRAASMGMVVFGLPSLVLLALARRVVLKKQ